LQDRQAFYESTHLQTIEFEIARQVVALLTQGSKDRTAKMRLQSRHQLFPDVYRIVHRYVATKVKSGACDPRELGLAMYVQRAVERLVAAIEPNDDAGEPPLLPLLNRYREIGTTGWVDFKTTRPTYPTYRSHIDQVVADTQTWEQSAAFRLEEACTKRLATFYAKNDHMEFSIPYEYQGVSHGYLPDFLVRLADGRTVVLEIKGYEDDEVKAKSQSAKRWIAAVNHWGQLGRWAYHLCKVPAMLERELRWILENPTP
jgi:type III restriction enzyme